MRDVDLPQDAAALPHQDQWLTLVTDGVTFACPHEVLPFNHLQVRASTAVALRGAEGRSAASSRRSVGCGMKSEGSLHTVVRQVA